MCDLRFDGKVAIITGAGSGLGKAYALLLASRGAKVVVNDLGVDSRGVQHLGRPADVVVEEIRRNGGTAIADYNSVVDATKIVATALDRFGRVDILINNAGVLRDKSFPRISKEDWDIVINVHLKATFLLTQAVFPLFKKQGYGRIIMTTSVSGLYGNFGQANYAAAKMGVVGLAKTVAIEGGKSNVHCNVIVPLAASRLTDGIIPNNILKELKPEFIAPVVAYLCHDSCTENGVIIDSAVGWAGKTHIVRGEGALLRKSLSDSVTIESVRDNWAKVVDMNKAKAFEANTASSTHYQKMIEKLEQGDTSSVKVEYEFTRKDAILYALSVGASLKLPEDLKFVYEKHDNFSVLPSFYIQTALLSIFKIDIIRNAIPGKIVSTKNILHGEHYLEIVGNVPLEGKIYSTISVVEILDKGSAGVVISNVDSYNEWNELVMRNQIVFFVMGCGNFGGSRSGSKCIPGVPCPRRKPDRILDYVTSIDQAAFFRLAGDDNPLHIDPKWSKMFGFDTPILHGLCTLGISVKLIIAAFANSDVRLFKAVKVRFSKTVVPGQTIRVNAWQVGKRVHFETVVLDNNTVAISGAYVDFNSVTHSKL